MNLDLSDCSIDTHNASSIEAFAQEIIRRVDMPENMILKGGSDILFSILIEINSQKVILKITDLNLRDLVLNKLSIDEYRARISQPIHLDNEGVYLSFIDVYSLGSFVVKDGRLSFIIQPFIEGLDRVQNIIYMPLILKLQRFMAKNGFIVDSFAKNWFVSPDEFEKGLYDILYYDLLLFNDPEILRTAGNITKTLIDP